MSRQNLLVAVGVVVNAACDMLVARRRADADHPGLWEFPGGKVEANEAVYDALCRELKEEVAIEVLAAEPLIQIAHDYQPYSVTLDTWLITSFAGQPTSAEGQQVRWANLTTVQQLPMPAANQAIIAALSRCELMLDG